MAVAEHRAALAGRGAGGRQPGGRRRADPMVYLPLGDRGVPPHPEKRLPDRGPPAWHGGPAASLPRHRRRGGVADPSSDISGTRDARSALRHGVRRRSVERCYRVPDAKAAAGETTFVARNDPHDRRSRRLPGTPIGWRAGDANTLARAATRRRYRRHVPWCPRGLYIAVLSLGYARPVLCELRNCCPLVIYVAGTALCAIQVCGQRPGSGPSMTYPRACHCFRRLVSTVSGTSVSAQ